MTKIHILGGPGSGKSYIAAKISSRFKIPSYELDTIFWDNDSKEYGVL